LKKFPLVSICISTYSRPDLFESSLNAILKQVYPNLEILVLIDGSNPNSIKLCNNYKDPRLKVYQTKTPSGMVGSWNFICSKAKGKYILFCADDDILINDSITNHVEVLESDNNIQFVHSDFLFINDESKIIGRSQTKNYKLDSKTAFKKFILKTNACMQTVVFRRKSWIDVGKWKDFGNPSDNYLWLKLIEKGGIFHLNMLTCKYRIRTNIIDPPIKKISNHLEFHLVSSKALFNTTLLSKIEKFYYKILLNFRTIKNIARVLVENKNFKIKDIDLSYTDFKYLNISDNSITKFFVFINDKILILLIYLKNNYYKT